MRRGLMLGFGLLMFTSIAMAYGGYQHTGVGMHEAGGVGDWASFMLGPTKTIGKLVHILCFITGAGFIVGSLIQYKYHRENPQQVRISTPIFMLILGVAIVAVPLLSHMSTSSSFMG